MTLQEIVERFRGRVVLHAQRTPRHFREQHFATWATNRDLDWLYEPIGFHLTHGFGTYTPDFYFPTTHVFIEVVGTRQALSAARKKIYQFTTDYPMLKFHLMNWDGTAYGTTASTVFYQLATYARRI